MRAVQGVGLQALGQSGFVYIESLEPRLAEFAAVLFAFMFIGMEGLMVARGLRGAVLCSDNDAAHLSR